MHTVKYNGISKQIDASTHVDDHPNDESWIKRHDAEIRAAFGLGQFAVSAANFVITHKPFRPKKPPHGG
jgi:hypothetical protein